MTKQNTPKVRFVGFRDDWNNRYLVDIIESQVKGKAKLDKLLEGEVAYLDASYLNGGEVFYTNGVKDVQYDDILIMWDGSNAGKVFTGFSGSLGSTLKGYRLEQGQNSSFVYQYLVKNQSKIYECYRTPNIPHVVKNFTKIFPISLPSKSEQSQIGLLFSTIVSLLSSYKDNLENYQTFKKSMLSKMFPKAGQTEPEIRLDGFEGDWETKKLGDLGTVAMNKRIFKDETSETGEIPFYKIGTFGGIADSFISREQFEEYREKFSYPKYGDILISASGSIGRTVEYLGEDAYFQDSNIVWLEHDNRLENSFLKQYYSIVKWNGIEGTTIKRLYNKNILNTFISLPEPDEQRSIGSFFSNLDDLISSYQTKIEELETLKKKLLQDMFI